MAQSTGKVSQIIGPVVDVDFSGENNPLPKIYDALEISKQDGSKLILEVQSHIGEGNSKNDFYGLYRWSKPRDRSCCFRGAQYKCPSETTYTVVFLT
jgi:hypothetical protein